MLGRTPCRSFWTWSGGWPHVGISACPQCPARQAQRCPVPSLAVTLQDTAWQGPMLGGARSLALFSSHRVQGHSSYFPSWGMSPMYAVCVLSSGACLSSPPPPKYVMPLPSSRPHMPPGATLSLLDPPPHTHTLSPHGCVAHGILSGLHISFSSESDLCQE